ncbi:Chromosome partition protein Smc [Candidatus Hydrogenisulfobacillus filiaventi]|uniref:Chromosome partition protein Smc n=1 Tax=Candidatus Hydrogenisulfobacillus filiaventi TaxID=2707344 RepID=A0A6F8ZGM2_9FIRM|nr:AAA family ATPase [Bacillota bacterium]CAB1129090.1 Chromosome partition protein Smc [Candidatus Hydrogenisulfobacillus filiaventi]
MYLREIRLYGFKSFAEPTRLVLAPGITALVGPNGGGKSNVVDAIRWALGEQRPRELRLARWEDLLAQPGGETRPRPLAEVRLLFDNADGQMERWPELLEVGRRYYRSGESEYLLDNRPVSLKEVTGLFLDSGLGRFSYAIIGQGRVEQALLQRPEERLEQIEEAAGTSRYKLRRREALVHLSAATEKEARIADLLAEARREAEAVAAAAEREREYRTWSEQADRARRELDRHRLARVLAEAAEQEAALRALADQLEQAGRSAAAAEEEVTRRERAARHADLALAATRQELEDTRRQQAEQAAEVARLEAQLEARTREAAGLADDVADARRRQQELEAGGEAGPAPAELEAARAAAGRAGSALEEALERERAARAALEAARAREQGVEARWLRWQGRLGLESSADLAVRRQEAGRLADKVRGLRDEAARLAAERERLRSFVAGLRSQVDTLRHQQAQRQARLSALRQAEAEGDGLAPGVRAILRAASRGQLEGILGTAGSLVQPRAEAAVAIWAALGAAHQDVVVEGERHARAAVRYLQAHGLGRATFLPLDTVRSTPVPAADLPLGSSPGAVGWAMDLVECPPRVEPAIRHLLGRTLVCRTLEEGVILGRTHGFRYRTVTLDGQLLHPGGAITGGSPSARDSRLARRTERERAARQVEEGLALLAGREELLRGSEQELARLEEQWAFVRETLARTEAEWQQAQALWEGWAEEAGDELPALRQQAAAEREAAETQLAAAAAAVETARAARDQALTALRGLESRAAAARAAAGERRRRLEDAARTRAELEARLTAVDRIREGLGARLTAAREAEALTRRRLEVLDGQLAVQTAAAGEQRQAVEAARQAVRAWDLERARLERQRAQLEQVRQRTLLERSQLEERGVRDPVILDEEERLRLERERARAERALEQLGPVEPGSLALWERLQERVVYYQGQLGDVQAGREELERTIAELDQEMARRREEAGRAVEAAFAAACRELFGGGDAGLRWGPEGVDLWVAPPGKRPGSLALLSGGEKALGGIAWLFALLQVRPAPLVVLDEVEASLDEANARRFARYLAAHRQGRQVLVVTHHHPTMEAADVLWGVGGDGRGSSRLLSVRLTPEPAAAPEGGRA